MSPSAISTTAIPTASFCSECALSAQGKCTHVKQAANAVDSRAITKRLAAIGVIGNLALSAVKLAAGILGSSSAMVSDAVHSLSDVAATIVAFVGVRIAAKQADSSHPYGHERFECLASMVLGVILACTGLGIGYSGISAIASFLQGSATVATPTLLPLGAAAVSILAKEAMARYTLHWARVANSDAFKADALHHRSDALSSVGALAGIGASLLGFPLGDPIASLAICVMILYMAYEVVRDAVNKMVDTPCTLDEEEQLIDCINAVPGVIRLDVLRTRMFGAKVYVDAEIAVDGDMPLRAAHDVAESVHDRVEANFPEVKHIMIHVNPA